MDNSKVMPFIIWFIVVTILSTISMDLINLPDTLCNIAGIILGLIIIYVSIKTKCFTNIKLKKD
jgi:uncharacterized protein with PQ loop repeat